MRQSIAVLAATALAGACIAAGSDSHPDQRPESVDQQVDHYHESSAPCCGVSAEGIPAEPRGNQRRHGDNHMKLTNSRSGMADDSATMTPKECLAIDGSAQAQVYANSGFMAEPSRRSAARRAIT